MAASYEKLFRAPYSVPNGIQLVDEGLWLADQITDRVALVEPKDMNPYGVTKWIREINTESSNTSGLTVGEGALWLAMNGPATIWRPARPTDAKQGLSEVLKVDPATGKTLGRYPVPGGGGVHGIEYDPLEPGMIWVTTLKSQTLTKIRTSDWEIQHVIPLPYTRAHGVVRVPDGIWVVHTSDRAIVKLDVSDGKVLNEIRVPTDMPEPHCLTKWGDDMAFCDATSGWVVRVSGVK